MSWFTDLDTFLNSPNTKKLLGELSPYTTPTGLDTATQWPFKGIPYEVPPGGPGPKTPEQIAAEKAAADKAAEEAARKAAAEAFQNRLNGILTKNQNFQTGQSNFLNSAYEGAKARMAPRQIAQPYNTAEPYSFTRDQAYTDPRQFLARSPTGFNKDTVAPPSAMTPPSVQPPEYGGGGGRDGGGGGRNGDGHGGDGDIRIPEYGQDFTGGRYEGAMIQGGYDQYGNLNGSDASRRAIVNPPTRAAPAQLRTFAEGGLSSLPQSPYYMSPDLLKPVTQDTVDTAQPMYRDRVQAIIPANPWTKEEPKTTPTTDSLLSPEIQATVLQLSQGRGGPGSPAERADAKGGGEGGLPVGLAGPVNSFGQFVGNVGDTLGLGKFGLNSLSHAITNAAINGAMVGSGAAANSSSSTAPDVGVSKDSGWGRRDAGGGETGPDKDPGWGRRDAGGDPGDPGPDHSDPDHSTGALARGGYVGRSPMKRKKKKR